MGWWTGESRCQEVPVRLYKLGKQVVVRKREIEHRGWISCAPLETAEENDVYECWGKVDMVDLELEPLDRKRRRWERVWVILPKRSCWSSVFANEWRGTMYMRWRDLYWM